MIRKEIRWTLALSALTLGGMIQPAFADTAAVIDEGTANGLCITSSPGTTGPDPLSPCQWDMTVIGAGPAHAKKTCVGVNVGVIDGGVDFSHPDLA